MILSSAFVRETHAMSKIVGQDHIASEGDAEGMVEIQHFQQPFSPNLMQITVGQRADVRRRLTNTLPILAPEIIAKDVVHT